MSNPRTSIPEPNLDNSDNSELSFLQPKPKLSNKIPMISTVEPIIRNPKIDLKVSSAIKDLFSAIETKEMTVMAAIKEFNKLIALSELDSENESYYYKENDVVLDDEAKEVVVYEGGRLLRKKERLPEVEEDIYDVDDDSESVQFVTPLYDPLNPPALTNRGNTPCIDNNSGNGEGAVLKFGSAPLKSHEKAFKKLLDLLNNPEDDPDNFIDVMVTSKVNERIIRAGKQPINIYECRVVKSRIIVPLLTTSQLQDFVVYRLPSSSRLIFRKSLGLYSSCITLLNKDKCANEKRCRELTLDHLTHLKFLQLDTNIAFEDALIGTGFKFNPITCRIVTNDEKLYIFHCMTSNMPTYILVTYPAKLRGDIVAFGDGIRHRDAQGRFLLVIPKHVVFDYANPDKHLMEGLEYLEVVDWLQVEAVMNLIAFWNTEMGIRMEQMYHAIDDVEIKDNLGV